MHNRITISIPFSFKGESFFPRSTIDLDEQMEQGGIPCLYTHIANENQISPYSYEHDIMMMGELVIDEAAGMATEFVHDSSFDSEGFEAKWKQEKLNNTLQEIATRCLNSGSGEISAAQNQALKNALLEAYELGKETG